MADCVADLVERARQGDSAAFDSLVGRYQDAVYGAALATVGNPDAAEDIAQDAFVEAFLKLKSLREPAKFPGWLRRLTISACSRFMRGQHREEVPIEAASDIASSAPSPAEIAERDEMKDMVLEAIQSLSDANRMATTLFYINGYSINEVAGFLEVPAGTVKRRLHDSRKKLKRRMIEMVKETLTEKKPGPEFLSRVREGLSEVLARPELSDRTLQEDGILWHDEALQKGILAGHQPGILTDEEISRRADFLFEACSISPESKILELESFEGKLSIALAKRGCRVVGMEDRWLFLERARDLAEQSGVTIDLISESVIKKALPSKFDVIVWTDRGLRGLSGFSDENILRALRHISEMLSIGGRFFCEVNNRDAEVRQYGVSRKEWCRFGPPASSIAAKMVEQGLPTPQKELMLVERDFDVLRGRGNGCDYFVGADGDVHEFVMSARVYTFTEFELLIRAAGLAAENVYGDWTGGKLSVESEKLLVVAKKVE